MSILSPLFPPLLPSLHSLPITTHPHTKVEQTITPVRGQDAVCCVIQRNVGLSRGSCSPDTIRCTYSDWAGPSMTRRTPQSSRIEEGTSSGAQRRMSSGEFCGPNKGSFSQCQWMCDPKKRSGLGSLPLAPPPSHTTQTKKGATLLHKQITDPRWSFLFAV